MVSVVASAFRHQIVYIVHSFDNQSFRHLEIISHSAERNRFAILTLQIKIEPETQACYIQKDPSQ